MTMRALILIALAAVTSGAQVPPDSALAAARQAGTQVAQRRHANGWFVAGALVPPVLFSATAMAAANQRNHVYALPVAVAFDVGALVGMRRLVRRTEGPSDSTVTNAIGAATDAERAAFDEAYRSAFRQQSARQYRNGLLFSGVTLGLFTVAVFVALSGS